MMALEIDSPVAEAVRYALSAMRRNVEDGEPQQEYCGIIARGEDALDPVRLARYMPERFLSVRNTAPPYRAHSSFEMSPDDMRDASWGEWPLAGEVEVTAMFHSHPGGLVGPSDADVQHFPRWLCRRGWVFTPDWNLCRQEEVHPSERSSWLRAGGALVAYDETGRLAELTGTFWDLTK